QILVKPLGFLFRCARANVTQTLACQPHAWRRDFGQREHDKIIDADDDEFFWGFGGPAEEGTDLKSPVDEEVFDALWEGGEVVEDRFELIAGDTTPLRHVLPLSESLGEVIRELQSQTLASPRLQQILGDIELLSVEVRQYARDYLSIAGQPGRNSYKLTDVERRRGILTRKLRAVEQQVKTLRDGLR
ncbi:MAG: hypothetical protein N3A53_05905, partial [Verrucomicrobiae bacterium]|nr:hypothetical protein [Verrucomicrobiae bacterium]